MTFYASCGKSNEHYTSKVNHALKSITKPGTKKEEVLKFLEENKFSYQLTDNIKCVTLNYKWEDSPCGNGDTIMSKIKIKKLPNPVGSSVNTYFFFNTENSLIEYRSEVIHSFL